MQMAAPLVGIHLTLLSVLRPDFLFLFPLALRI